MNPGWLGPTPHPVTRPWCGGPGAMYSWEVAYRGGSASGISETKHRAMKAVAEVLQTRDGHGIIQACSLGPHCGDLRSQYAYGNVLGRARGTGGTVRWAVP